MKDFQKKILVSVKFVSAILGPETAAPILWTRRISAFFLQENLHVHKIPRLGGGGLLGLGGGGIPGSADFIFMGAGIFLRFSFAPAFLERFFQELGSLTTHTPLIERVAFHPLD